MKKIICLCLIISSLPSFGQKTYPMFSEASALSNNDLFLIWQTATNSNKKVTLQALQNSLSFPLPVASSTVAGGVKVGTGLFMSGGYLNNSYPFPGFGFTHSTSAFGDVLNYSKILVVSTVTDRNSISSDYRSLGQQVYVLSDSTLYQLRNGITNNNWAVLRYENIANKNIANGYAGVGSDGLILSSLLPSLVVSNTYIDANVTEMLTGTRNVGDISVRTDSAKTLILKTTPSSNRTNWVLLQTPTNSPVLTVNSRIGNIILMASDVGIPNYSTGKWLKSGTSSMSWADINWGNINGSLSSQTDLNSALAGKEPTVATGTTSQYYRGDKVFAQINLSNGVFNALPIANGGTGQTTANSALNAFLPSQSDNNGKILQTNGSNAVWADIVTFNGNRAITTTSWPTGINPGTTTIPEFLEKVFYASVAPIATIALTSGGQSREYMASGANLTQSLDWTVTRPTACLSITNITVNSASQTLDSPFAEGHTQTGILANQPLARNTNTTFTISTNSTDKSTSANVSVYWYWQRYWGVFSTSSIPVEGVSSFISNAQILALLSSELATNCTKNFGSVACSNQYFIYVVKHSWCTGGAAFTINTFPTDFIKVWDNVSFTNVSDGVMSVDVYVSPNKYNGTITVTAQ